MMNKGWILMKKWYYEDREGSRWLCYMMGNANNELGGYREKVADGLLVN